MVISFSKLGTHGRLANCLFQLSSTIGLAEHYDAIPALPVWKYEPYFDNHFPHGPLQTIQVKEKHFHHHDWELKEDCDLFGYLQSEKYFGSFRLKFKQSYIDTIKAKAPELWDKKTICIHVRRGDYVGNPNYYQLPITYYIDSLYTYFPNWKQYNIVVISDDIEYCKIHFECLSNVYFSKGSEIEDLALGSCCDHFIIPNSSYGWWAAWLGEKEDTKVVHPGHSMIGKLADNDTKDYWPDRWVRNQKDSYKIDLKDVTFTIPVHYDHLDRKKNLDLCLCMLQSAFNTNVIIQEQGGNKFEYTKQWTKYSRVDSKVFHRTKMLNDMANEATTPIVVNWDCDVIIAPTQILTAVEKIRNGADMVFPYDGKFARIPRLYNFEKIEKCLDIGVVGNTPFAGRVEGHNSVGGAVMFRKDSFIEGGMENEYMISFGPEDCERNDRFKALGFRVERVGGALFHINHYVGLNSNSINPHFHANHAELEKIRAMKPEEVRQYVDTWPWRPKYTDAYYGRICEGAVRSAKHVYAALEEIGLKFETIIDVGCGVGEWNYKTYSGVDYKVNKDKLLFQKERYMEFNLDKEMPEGYLKFDLAICLEVAEHLFEERAKPLIQSLCGLSDKVLFSAAVPYQGGTGHINEQWQTWWAALFAEHGFYPALKQPDIRDNKEIELWYRNNIVLYEKDGKGSVVDFILPEFYEEIIKGCESNR